jgi:tetratricopeptide (TPR) repeat protein
MPIQFILLNFIVFSLPLLGHASMPVNDLFTATEQLLARQEYDSAWGMLARQPAGALDDNAILYLRVAVEQAILLDYESYLIDGDRFYRFADSTRKILSGRLPRLRGTDSLRCVYYLAGIEGGMAVVQGKTGGWVSALEYAASSASRLKLVMKRDSALREALLGIGIYHYYLGRSFGWLPFIKSGSRDTGYAEIERASRLPFPSDFPAKNSLCWILIDRKQYEPADSIAQTALMEVPRSTLFLQIRSLCRFRENRYAEAIEFAERLAAISAARKPVNWSDLVLSSFVLTASYDALGKGREAEDAGEFIANAGMPEAYRRMPHIKREMNQIEEILRRYRAIK